MLSQDRLCSDVMIVATDVELSPTPSRVLLRKSRTGCRECKIRKVKCDEIRPVCSNCRRRFVGLRQCDWSRTHARVKAQAPKRQDASYNTESKALEHASSPLKSQNLQVIRTWSSPMADTNQWRSLELRLMHHYTTVVCDTMPDCNGLQARDMWDRRIPQKAFEDEVVLNPMLALSALHLHAHAPSNVVMSIALRRYLDRSLRNHVQALRDSAEEISEQLWLSAVILSKIHWLLARQALPDESYKPPVLLWKMLQGTIILFRQGKSRLSTLGYAWFGEELDLRILPVDELTPTARAQFYSIRADLKSLFHTFKVFSLPQEEQKMYEEAENFILSKYLAYFSGSVAKTLRRYIGLMAISCTPAFTANLERNEPLAMALMARMLVLLKGLEPAWWMNGEGDYKVLERDIPGMLELMPESLRWTMDWPCKVLNGEILLTRS